MDRDETLRRAERLLRENRPDAAAEQYARVVASTPGDLATANALGDLYVRMGRPDLAMPIYLQVAEAFHREGFYARAAAYYRKILKHEPGSEPVLLRLADACHAQRLDVEARGCLQAVLDARQRRGDGTGADQVVVRLADLDPDDLELALASAPARARVQGAQAMPALRAALSALERAGRAAEGAPLLRLMAILTPPDAATPPAEPQASRPGPASSLEPQASSPGPASSLEPQASSLGPASSLEPQASSLGPASSLEPQASSLGPASSLEPQASSLFEADTRWALDAVFARLRHAAQQASGPPTSPLALATTYLAAGLDADARPLLEAAVADAATRQRAAWLLADVCERQRQLSDAARWLECASEAAEPGDPALRLAALERLGDVFERLHEPVRALQVWREARAIAGPSADLDDRIARVAAAGPGGGGSFPR
jgi:tetratricopeptide (TPR) repeat protein